jgi:hypothetical protein
MESIELFDKRTPDTHTSHGSEHPLTRLLDALGHPPRPGISSRFLRKYKTNGPLGHRPLNLEANHWVQMNLGQLGTRVGGDSAGGLHEVHKSATKSARASKPHETCLKGAVCWFPFANSLTKYLL